MCISPPGRRALLRCCGCGSRRAKPQSTKSRFLARRLEAQTSRKHRDKRPKRAVDVDVDVTLDSWRSPPEDTAASSGRGPWSRRERGASSGAREAQSEFSGRSCALSVASTESLMSAKL